MSEDMKKKMEKLDVNDLENVNGGTGLTDLVGALFGKKSKAGRVGNAVRTAECCGENAVNETGLSNTVKAMCPVCGKETEFTIFSGARARCNVCGNIRLDM
ncbi:MAG: hypothetical protein IJ239_03705 [Eubacterium sp.]|nr:hypothetical protein [Eubacterium sp.]